jgi:hypothetical protein
MGIEKWERRLATRPVALVYIETKGFYRDEDDRYFKILYQFFLKSVGLELVNSWNASLNELIEV